MSVRSVTQDQPTLPAGAVALAALFVASLVTAQLTASKVLQFELPFALPVTGAELALPGAALAYALTFLASDCYTELYGKRAAQVLVNVGFLMNFLVLALVWSTILAPAAPSSIDPAAFETVLGASTNIVAASLLAYVVSQNYDVVVFHWIKEQTSGERLWLRNIVSTGTSQAIDTVIFVGVAFWLLPRAIGLGPVLPGDVVVALMIGQYLLKLGIAVLDTPLVYLVVGAVRRYEVSPA
ncbi:putative member of the PurR regulon [Halalkaliarchaeum sp. AArc-CO]|uniref:queuosine precursor transporter n=1 Tax=Halalkaliarchaeum sp. AArc-CO TaxID=2866381 RepID=UPI00217E3C3B|nr:queuosine precursor transporter [Halalkaliarchaeum sp. AArc-CO]UWG49720.1 putative member of the PurR regulon [Halalkaliarchaeum sp. AArc-CO]